MRAKVKYGALITGVGLLLWFGGIEIGGADVLMYGGMTGIVVGGLMLYLAYEKWYCAACGQVLSRGSKPDRCERCGSNRVTTKDPGAVR
ncbi:hypothetical protein [Salinigranum halophilum]|uniref:hypothetical protein n=1 Tax=Salinigranum halophilum TaxID=2565931 RepID=UPI00115E5E26|nr:hypothetical protein [Salinigranum halophilum]